MTELTENTINELSKEIHSISVEKGFWDESKSMKELMVYLSNEVAKSLNEYLNSGDPVYYSESGVKPEGYLFSLVDTAIRILDILGGIDKITNEMNDMFLETIYLLKDLAINSATVSETVPYSRVYSEDKLNFRVNLKSMLFLIDVELEERGYSLLALLDEKLNYLKTKDLLYER